MSVVGAEAWLVVVSAMWGLTFPCIRIAMSSGTSPFSFVGIRFVMATAVSLPLAARGMWRDGRALILPSVGLGLLNFSVYIFQTIGMQTTSAAKSGFITGTNVVMVPFLDALIRGSKLSGSAMAGAAIAVAGMYLLAGLGHGSTGAWEQASVGDLWTLACAFSHALYLVLLQRHLPRFESLPFVTGQIGTVAAASLVVGPLVEEWSFDWSDVPVVSSLLYCALFATVFATLLHFRFQAEVEPVRSALIFALEPVFGALCSAAVLSERLGAHELCGCGLIMAGVLVSEAGPRCWAALAARREDWGSWSSEYPPLAVYDPKSGAKECTNVLDL